MATWDLQHLAARCYDANRLLCVCVCVLSVLVISQSDVFWDSKPGCNPMLQWCPDSWSSLDWEPHVFHVSMCQALDPDQFQFSSRQCTYPPWTHGFVLDLLFSGLIQGVSNLGDTPQIDRLHIALQVLLHMLRHDQSREVVEHLRSDCHWTLGGKFGIGMWSHHKPMGMVEKWHWVYLISSRISSPAGVFLQPSQNCAASEAASSSWELSGSGVDGIGDGVLLEPSRWAQMVTVKDIFLNTLNRFRWKIHL